MQAYYTTEIYTDARGSHEIHSLVIEGDDRAELYVEFIAELYAMEKGHPLHTYNAKGTWSMDTDHHLIDLPNTLPLTKLKRWMDATLSRLGITQTAAVITR